MFYFAVFGDQAARQEMERQRREEWERGKREELSRRKTGEQEEISRLRAKKKSLELELEAVVSARSSYVFNSKKGLPLRSASRCHRATSTSRSPTASATLRVRGGSSRRRWTSSTRRGTPASQRSTLCSSTLRQKFFSFYLWCPSLTYRSSLLLTVCCRTGRRSSRCWSQSSKG